MPYTYVYLAGHGNSGPQHWQRQWFEQHGGHWVEHADWLTPKSADWIADLEAVAKALPAGPVVLIAHSLGCLLAAQWLAAGGKAAAAYLVAAPDASDWMFPATVEGFGPASSLSLALPCRVVASHDDPFSTFSFAKRVAETWHAQLWDVGEKGHINADSGLGAWPEGWQDLQNFLGALKG